MGHGLPPSPASRAKQTEPPRNAQGFYPPSSTQRSGQRADSTPSPALGRRVEGRHSDHDQPEHSLRDRVLSNTAEGGIIKADGRCVPPARAWRATWRFVLPIKEPSCYSAR